MRAITKLLRRCANVLLTEERAGRLISCVAYVTGTDLLSVAYRAMGIGHWGNVTASGEDRFARDMLPCILNVGGDASPVLFDVGANKGEYCRLLRECYPKARIYAFEPNAQAFAILDEFCRGAGIQAMNIGLGAQKGTAMLTVPQGNLASSHGTLHPEVFYAIHHSRDNMVSETVNIKTAAAFALEAGIARIDFMKIDTEGHELAVLQGCGEMLRTGAIRVIQFEFNQMNVISRVFLRDFYDLLDERYTLFRLAPNALVPLGAYHTRNEIFLFQNIVAILKPLAGLPELSAHIRR